MQADSIGPRCGEQQGKFHSLPFLSGEKPLAVAALWSTTDHNLHHRVNELNVNDKASELNGLAQRTTLVFS